MTGHYTQESVHIMTNHPHYTPNNRIAAENAAIARTKRMVHTAFSIGSISRLDATATLEQAGCYTAEIEELLGSVENE